MNRPVAPIRRERARQPEAGSTLLRRYGLLSLVLHVSVGGLSLLSFPALRHHERKVFAPRIYEVALVPAPIPNYEPPIPQPEKRKEPVPLKPVKVPETKPKDKPNKESLKEALAVKTSQPPPKAKPTPTTAGTSEKPQTPTSSSAPEEHPISMGQVDQANFHQDYYLEMIRSILVRLWEPPTGGNGLYEASIHFIIQKDGTITDPQISAASGWALYDRSALGAVMAALHKLPPLPESYEGNELGLTVNFQRVEEANQP
jgi:outer membrane biosynthesis protein TonB